MKEIICPTCGELMGWDDDIKRSDVAQVEDKDDDAIVSIYGCQNCGTSVEIYEPTEEEKKDFPYWSCR